MSLLSPINCGDSYTFLSMLKKLTKKDADGNFYVNTTGLGETDPYCAAYRAVYDAFTTKPSDAVAAIWNDLFVCPLVASGDWALLDYWNTYAVHTNGDGEALINWKNPGTLDAIAYNAPTFTASQGFLGNGTTQYIDTRFVPSVSGVNYTQNSASQLIYIRTNFAINGTRYGVYGSADNKNIQLCPRAATGNAYINTNDNSEKSFAITRGDGMFINTRIAAAVNKLYQNKIVIINATVASLGVPTHSPYALAVNDDDVAAAFRQDQVSCYGFGAGMDQNAVNRVSDAFNAAMTALGTNVY